MPPLSPYLIPRSTPPTPTTHTFDRLLLPQPSLGHATDARSVKVILLGLYAAQTAQLLVALLLPLGDEVRVAVAVLQQPVVEVLAYGLLVVVEVVDVTGALVRDLEDGPGALVLALAFVGGIFRWF